MINYWYEIIIPNIWLLGYWLNYIGAALFVITMVADIHVTYLGICNHTHTHTHTTHTHYTAAHTQPYLEAAFGRHWHSDSAGGPGLGVHRGHVAGVGDQVGPQESATL